jgi:hypothetical protein
MTDCELSYRVAGIRSVVTVRGRRAAAELDWQEEERSRERVLYLGTGEYGGAGLKCRMRVDLRRDGRCAIQHTVIVDTQLITLEALKLKVPSSRAMRCRQEAGVAIPQPPVIRLVTSPIDWQMATVLGELEPAWVARMPQDLHDAVAAESTDTQGLGLTHDICLSFYDDEPAWPPILADRKRHKPAMVMPPGFEMFAELAQAWWHEFTVPLEHEDNPYHHPLLEDTVTAQRYTKEADGIYPDWYRWWISPYQLGEWLLRYWVLIGQRPLLDMARRVIRQSCDQVIQEATGTNKMWGSLRPGREGTPFVWHIPGGGHRWGFPPGASRLLQMAGDLLDDRRALDLLGYRVEFIEWWIENHVNVQADWEADPMHWVWTLAGPSAFEAMHDLLSLHEHSGKNIFKQAARRIVKVLTDPNEPHGLSEEFWERFRGGASYLWPTYKLDHKLTGLWDAFRKHGWKQARDAAVAASTWAIDNEYQSGGGGPGAMTYQSHRGHWLAELVEETGSEAGKTALRELVSDARRVLDEYKAVPDSDKGAAMFALRGRPDDGNPMIPGLPDFSVQDYSAPAVLFSLPAASAARVAQIGCTERGPIMA